MKSAAVAGGERTAWRALLTEPRGLAWSLAALGALHAVVFLPGMLSLWEKWTRPDGYYGHGPLGVAVVAWLIWRDREALARLPQRAAASGLVAIALAMWLLKGARGANIAVAEHYALWLSLLGSTAVVGGWALVRRAWFAWAFTLVAVIPLPRLLVERLTWGLKLWATEGAFAVLNLVGTAAVREGGTIHLAGGQTLYVDDVCSGLRSVVALVALAAVFAYFQPVRWRAGVTLALALPLAVVANSLRVLFLCVCAAQGAESALAEPWHGLSGVVSFLFALGALGALQGQPAQATAGAGTRVEADRLGGGVEATSARPWLVRVAVALLVAAGCLAGRSTPRRLLQTEPASRVTASIPYAVNGWLGRDVDSPLDLPGVFKTDDYVFREYRHPEETQVVELFVLHGETLEQGLHGPHGCYLLQGFRELEVGPARLPIGGNEQEVGRALIEHDTNQRRALVYFYYRVGRDLQAFPAGYSVWLRPRQFLAGLGMPLSEPACTVRISTALTQDPRLGEAALRRFSTEVLGEVQSSLTKS